MKMTEEEKWEMSRGISDPDSNIEAKAAVACFLLFMCAIVAIGICFGIYKLVEHLIA